MNIYVTINDKGWLITNNMELLTPARHAFDTAQQAYDFVLRHNPDSLPVQWNVTP